MTTPILPTNERVAEAWLASLPGLSQDMVGEQLPQDQSKWSTSGFVQVTTVGGSPALYVPVAKPVVQLDFWAVNPSSAKAPWGKANNLAEVVRKACYVLANNEVTLTLAGKFGPARVMSAYFITEPRRIYGDQADHARYSADLQMVWVAA